MDEQQQSHPFIHHDTGALQRALAEFYFSLNSFLESEPKDSGISPTKSLHCSLALTDCMHQFFLYALVIKDEELAVRGNRGMANQEFRFTSWREAYFISRSMLPCIAPAMRLAAKSYLEPLSVREAWEVFKSVYSLSPPEQWEGAFQELASYHEAYRYAKNKLVLNRYWELLRIFYYGMRMLDMIITASDCGREIAYKINSTKTIEQIVQGAEQVVTRILAQEHPEQPDHSRLS